MRLYFYFAQRFAGSLFRLFLIFFVLTILLEMIEVLRKFDSSALGFLEILKLTALHAPRTIYNIVPLVVLLATLTLFLSLAKSSELVIARAAGRSALRTLISPIVVTLLLGALVVGVFNPIVTATIKQYDILETRYTKGVQPVLSLGPDGLWLRQGSETGQTVIHARRANSDGTELFEVTFFGSNASNLNSFRIEAESAQLMAGHWLAHNTKKWVFEAGENSELDAVTTVQLRIPTDLTGDQIRQGFGPPSSIAIWDLPAFIDRLKLAGFSTRSHEIQLQTQLALPFLLVTMVLIGAVFTMRHTRFGRTGIMVLLAVTMGFALFFVRNLASILGENGQIPVLLAAWAPPSAGILLALGLLLHTEDG